MLDALTRYDIDGLHFDDYFYPTNSTDFDDSAAFAQYGGGFPDLAAWRRHNVDLMVSEMQQRVRAAKPETAWGISPSGIWRNKGTDPLGSDTNGGQSYDNLHADTRGWVQQGLAGLHRAAALLVHRPAARRLRQAGAVVVRRGRRHRHPAVDRPGRLQGG